MLAVMLVHANEVVSIDRLADAVWGDQRPSRALPSMRNIIAEFRSLIGRECFETRPPGYRLCLEPDQLDALEFERLYHRATNEPGARRLETLQEALGLWTGPPYADVFYEDFAQAEIIRLEELRLSALESLYGTELETSSTATALPELQSLVEQNPYRETLRCQLMVALCRAGRHVEALDNYLRYKASLSVWQTQPGHAITETARALREGEWAIFAAPQPEQEALAPSSR
jgi:DNA-binding SARP family transcriptional activator